MNKLFMRKCQFLNLLKKVGTSPPTVNGRTLLDEPNFRTLVKPAERNQKTKWLLLITISTLLICTAIISIRTGTDGVKEVKSWQIDAFHQFNSQEIGVFNALQTLPFSAYTTEKKRIGVTLHPYYSFTANIVGNAAEVVPLIGAGFNPHNYRPQPEDIKRCMGLDIMVVNGISHDEFAFEIMEAAEMKEKLTVIFANKDVSLIPVSGTLSGEQIVNPHTFVSVTASIHQIYTISKGLQEADPANAEIYRKNTRNYVRSLRKMKAGYMKKVAGLTDLDFRCATIHGGYDYLLQEFGLQVTAVIESGHGLQPTASQLAKTIDTIKDLDVDVIFTEMDFPEKYVDTIHAETGIRIRHLSHLTKGEYTAESFEEGIRENLEALTSALLEAHTLHKGETT